MNQPTRQQQKQATKEKILLAAYQLYTENGFLTPTQKIAVHAGVSHGTIFVHFPNKDNLVTELLAQYFKTLGLQLRALAKNNASIAEVLENHLKLLEENEDFYKRFIMDLPLLPKECENAYIAFQSIVSNHFCSVIEREIHSNAIKPLPLHMLFNTWIALLHYYLQNSSLFAPEGAVIKRYKKELTATYLQLIKL